MKKLHFLGIGSLIILLSLVLVMGCQQQETPTPEPAPITTPSLTPAPTPEPLPPAPTPESAPEPETTDVESEGTAEPLIHSSAYIKFDGIDGESQNEGHEGWSEIVSFSQPISQPGGGATGPTRRRGDVVIEDIVVVKELDKASPKLAESICKGKVFPKVEIHLTGPSEGSTCRGTYYAYELKNVIITNYKVTGSNPLAYALIAPAPDITMPYSGPFIVQAVDAPMEELSLNFEEIKVTYTECDSSGKSKGNVEYSWKVEEGEY
jgi:type VI secretion system secreted protein Hcp